DSKKPKTLNLLLFSCKLMKHPASSNEYRTVYLKWPSSIPKQCPICQARVKKKYPDNGKLIHTLEGDVNQIVYFYACTNSKCLFHSKPFNLHPRFEFEGFLFGRDVVQKVAIYGIKENFKPIDIQKMLKIEYKFEISESTIRRMLQICTVVKSQAIDAKTKEIIQKQGFILLGLDGEDPQTDGPALWAFIDLLSQRVLYTVYLESAPAVKIQEEIKKIIEIYQVKIIGFVSDKQRSLVSCMRDYFPEIPHQFCSFHFSQNLWNHIELMDGRLHKKISKIIKDSYFLSCSADATVFFEEHGELKPVTVFAPIIKDLKKMRRKRTKKFESLRGLWLYEHFEAYTHQLEQEAKRLPEGYRMQKIFSREAEKWGEILTSTYSFYNEIKELFTNFQSIYQIIHNGQISSEKKEEKLEHEFNKIEDVLKIMVKNYDRSKLKSFQPTSKSHISDIYGEWVRLWYSYKPGLFQYKFFPIPIQTIVMLEQAFGQQKSRFYGRVSKKRIGQMILSEGDYQLRFVFCAEEELESDIYEEAIKYNWQQLNNRHNKRKQAISQNWLKKMEKIEGILGVSGLFYGERLP
ncbi:hypothetical protein, partial [Candidatus Harpocratesius sp.]